jgi:hypothetical protein
LSKAHFVALLSGQGSETVLDRWFALRVENAQE